jgi:hypothetical protein
VVPADRTEKENDMAATRNEPLEHNGSRRAGVAAVHTLDPVDALRAVAPDLPPALIRRLLVRRTYDDDAGLEAEQAAGVAGVVPRDEGEHAGD